MIGLLAPAVLAAVAAWLRAGSLAGLRHLSIRWWPLAVGSLVLKIALLDPPVNQQPWAIVLGPPLWVACMAAILAVLVRNAFEPGPARVAFQVAAVGLGLNLIVVIANSGYMPQSPAAHVAVWGAALPTDFNLTQLHNVTPAGPDARFSWLADVIPQPRWLPMTNVISIGDMILSLGMAGLIALTVGRHETHLRRNPADS